MDCQFEKQQVLLYQLGLSGKFITTQSLDSISAFIFCPPGYISVEIKKTPCIMNSFLISFSSPVENGGDDTSYKIFASESFVMPFKVLAVIAVDLHFDECFSFQSWGMEYFRSGGGTQQLHSLELGHHFNIICAAVCFCRKHSCSVLWTQLCLFQKIQALSQRHPVATGVSNI